jgi:hypothetical protein
MATNDSVDSIKVRMYRQGFGDCFLLSFYCREQRVLTMLIDCGIKYNTKSVDVPIEDVIADLKATLTPAGETKPQLDVLVATHEHWDHISYFHPTRSPDYFGDFEIGQVWLAWTENPNDDEAVTINSRLRDGAVALQCAAKRLRDSQQEGMEQIEDMYFGFSLNQGRMEFNQKMDDVLGFYGVTSLKEVSDSGIKYNPNGKISTLTQQAMEHLISLGANGGGIKYFSPGTTVDKRLLPPGVNVYVLGPPRSSLINKSNPSRGHAHETYMSIDDSGMTSFIDGLLGLDASGDGNSHGGASPFGEGVGIEKDEAEEVRFFAETYFAQHDAYRKIEHNWLDIAGQFALQLDGAINNTSLVLAIELADSGKVLLFPGDAQVGSWLSWHDFQWESREGSGTETRTAQDLLKHTVLYKVSHHGSHNATVRDKGLELMTHPDLVAMMPEKEDCYSGIPYEPLMERLNELCKGRVLVSADVNFPPEELLTDRPAELTAGQWASFKKDLVIERLYVEYTIRQ